MAQDRASEDSINLTNHFLIAMPGLGDAFFAKSVVYLCEHSERGALGLMINKATDITLQHLFEKVDLPLGRADLRDAPVFQGGPVQTERGFVLHDALSPGVEAPAAWAAVPRDGQHDAAPEAPNDREEGPSDAVYASTLVIPGAALEMTTSRDVLEALSNGAGPNRVLISLGYSAWAQGQLESEIGENSWLTVQVESARMMALIFDTPIEQRYEKALALLGLEAWMLSPDAGHA
ncbi:YqgE/AlgH family protein [Hylemonella sp. W303a]|uniref:YqgE/AlgH family protein n=1 Tax=Hylemonella sp. W303a TaxID=3389873 RepID=UPI00396B42D7